MQKHFFFFKFIVIYLKFSSNDLYQNLNFYQHLPQHQKSMHNHEVMVIQGQNKTVAAEIPESTELKELFTSVEFKPFIFRRLRHNQKLYSLTFKE